MADAGKIEVVIGNLLRNAVNYSPDGGNVVVVVEVTGTEAVVRVQDGGIGIPSEQLERIFDRFTRLDNRDSRTAFGYGLGLYISKGIIEQHGGRIWAESQVGEGSTFFFTLPLAMVNSGIVEGEVCAEGETTGD
jgi:signal transduction histidine kinase